MSLTNTDKESIAHIVAAVNKSARDHKTMGEMFMRISMTVCAAGIIGIFTMIFGMKYDLQANILETKHLTEEFKDYKVKSDAILSQPKFSKEDFSTAIQPMIQKIDLNTNEIALKRSWAARIEPVVFSNERDIKTVKDDIADIKSLLNELLKEKTKR